MSLPVSAVTPRSTICAITLASNESSRRDFGSVIFTTRPGNGPGSEWFVLGTFIKSAMFVSTLGGGCLSCRRREFPAGRRVRQLPNRRQSLHEIAAVDVKNAGHGGVARFRHLRAPANLQAGLKEIGVTASASGPRAFARQNELVYPRTGLADARDIDRRLVLYGACVLAGSAADALLGIHVRLPDLPCLADESITSAGRR